MCVYLSRILASIHLADGFNLLSNQTTQTVPCRRIIDSQLQLDMTCYVA